LSADGNTALVGGSSDDSFAGAAWVYTRSGGVWTQQGSKLVGTGAVGAARQGFSVALSGDGNTALVGGPVDDSQAGAAWVFTRSGGVWTQQGGKLVGTGAVGSVVQQGHSVGLSADGNTAIVGGPFDDSFAGAAWVYTRSGGVWTQQGAKLVGTGAAGAGEQGFSVGLSADGNFAILGGLNDNGLVGATWVFSRSGGVWTQYGAKLVGTGVVGSALQGSAAAISGDHRAILVGGVGDNGSGAAWVFAIPVSHDFNGDGMSDIAWRDTSGNAAMWEMNGTDITPGPVFGPIPTNWSIVGQRDFNGDGRSDWLWRDTIGHVAMWLLNGFQVLQVGSVGTVSTNWSIVGTADFDGDGKGDILWRDAMTGQAAIWLMNGTAMQSGGGDRHGDDRLDHRRHRRLQRRRQERHPLAQHDERPGGDMVHGWHDGRWRRLDRFDGDRVDDRRDRRFQRRRQVGSALARQLGQHGDLADGRHDGAAEQRDSRQRSMVWTIQGTNVD
jgi:hypothetical protein